MLEADLQLVREGNWVTLQSTHRPNWLILPFSLIPGVILVNWLSEPGPATFGVVFGIAIALGILLAGLFFLVPRQVVTVFDLRKGRLLHTLSFANGAYVRRHAYRFDEVAGLGLKEYREHRGGLTYMPVLLLKSGSIHYLGTANAGYIAFKDQIAGACEMIGFPQIDVPRKGRWPI